MSYINEFVITIIQELATLRDNHNFNYLSTV